MLESHDQGIVLILLENFFILNENLLESFHFSRFNAVYDLEIRREWLLKVRLIEDLSVWNISHEKLNDNLELLNLYPKSLGSVVWSSS